MRAIISVKVGDERLIGTYHEPDSAAQSAGTLASDEAPGCGMLLVNSGYAPRAGQVGFAALAGDVLAAEGIPVFRMDFPGLGDSPGSIPPDGYQFEQRVYSGAYVELTLALIDKLGPRYGLSSFVVGGLCGGAVTSVLAAERRSRGIAGLVLLEPLFELARPSRSARTQVVVSQAGLQGFGEVVRARIKRVTRWGKQLTARGTVGRSLWKLLDSSVLGKQQANSLVAAFRRVAERGMPMLVISAAEEGERIVRQDVFRSRSLENVTTVALGGTNHILSYGWGKQRAVEQIRSWLTGGAVPELSLAASVSAR